MTDSSDSDYLIRTLATAVRTNAKQVSTLQLLQEGYRKSLLLPGKNRYVPMHKVLRGGGTAPLNTPFGDTLPATPFSVIVY